MKTLYFEVFMLRKEPNLVFAKADQGTGHSILERYLDAKYGIDSYEIIAPLTDREYQSCVDTCKRLKYSCVEVDLRGYQIALLPKYVIDSVAEYKRLAAISHEEFPGNRNLALANAVAYIGEQVSALVPNEVQPTV